MTPEEIKHIEKLIERTYNHPDISPWHVREALREILKALAEATKEKQ